MYLIILNDGLYHLVEVTREMTAGIQMLSDVDCFDLCDILRVYLTTYHEPWNVHVMNDGTDTSMDVYVDNTYPVEREIKLG